jgi:hypothetical protein
MFVESVDLRLVIRHLTEELFALQLIEGVIKAYPQKRSVDPALSEACNVESDRAANTSPVSIYHSAQKFIAVAANPSDAPVNEWVKGCTSCSSDSVSIIEIIEPYSF